MNSRLAWQSITLAALFGAALVSHAGVASAQAALDDDDTPVAATDTSTTTSLEADNAPHVGVGLRLRSVKVPEGLLELFVEDAPGGSSELGYGLEVARRKGNFEVQFGIEYDTIYVREGNWLDKGDMLPQDEVDRILLLFPEFKPRTPTLSQRREGRLGDRAARITAHDRLRLPSPARALALASTNP